MNDEMIEKLAIEMTNKYFDIMSEEDKITLSANPGSYARQYFERYTQFLEIIKLRQEAAYRSNEINNREAF